MSAQSNARGPLATAGAGDEYCDAAYRSEFASARQRAMPNRFWQWNWREAQYNARQVEREQTAATTRLLADILPRLDELERRAREAPRGDSADPTPTDRRGVHVPRSVRRTIARKGVRR